MSIKTLHVVALVVLIAALLSACGAPAAAPAQPPAQQPAAAPAPTQPPAPAQPAAQQPAKEAAAGQCAGTTPTDLKLALVFLDQRESPWNTALLQALERVKAEKPHGLNISWDYTESVGTSDLDRVLRQYADSGKYQIMWAHSTTSDVVNKLAKEYPKLPWVVSGVGNEPKGNNVYWIDVGLQEPAYLAGVLAGKMTKSNVLGIVAAFPYGNVNQQLNGFVAGAKSVNPNAKFKTTFIENWYDPAKAKESAKAQIAAGADLIYAERFGVYDAAQEAGIFAFGSQVDQWDTSPKVVLTSAVENFDPNVRYMIDEWWNQQTKCTPYNAPGKPIIFTMKDGGASLAPFHGLDAQVPKEAMDAMQQAQAKIMDGSLQVPISQEPLPK